MGDIWAPGLNQPLVYYFPRSLSQHLYTAPSRPLPSVSFPPLFLSYSLVSIHSAETETRYLSLSPTPIDRHGPRVRAHVCTCTLLVCVYVYWLPSTTTSSSSTSHPRYSLYSSSPPRCRCPCCLKACIHIRSAPLSYDDRLRNSIRVRVSINLNVVPICYSRPTMSGLIDSTRASGQSYRSSNSNSKFVRPMGAAPTGRRQSMDDFCSRGKNRAPQQQRVNLEHPPGVRPNSMDGLARRVEVRTLSFSWV